MGLFNFIGRPSFQHGIHPPYHKERTADKSIRRLPFPERLVIPLNQHIGKPAKPVVRKGQEVVRGELIAEADGFVSVPVHAPATGKISGIELMPTARGPRTRSIILDVYQSSPQEVLWGHPQDLDTKPPKTIIAAVKDTGMVGLGGAAFPSHVKLIVPQGQAIDTLVVNGCECEPYLTCDHRIMLEKPAEVVRGTRWAMRALGAENAVIGVEDNKLDAVRALREHLPQDHSIRVEPVETKYPQGSEKMLIKSVLDLEVPAGGIPSRVGVVVNNVGTLAALGELLPLGEGMTERVITVTGPGIEHPGNYLVPLGTPIRFVLEQVGNKYEKSEVILGGPMMGSAISSLDTPVTKGTSGILVLHEPVIGSKTSNTWPCIKCARCVSACPMHLNPSELGLLAAKREYETMATRFHLFDCFECGCCSYVCPSNIPLVQYFRIAKAINREQAA